LGKGSKGEQSKSSSSFRESVAAKAARCRRLGPGRVSRNAIGLLPPIPPPDLGQFPSVREVSLVPHNLSAGVLFAVISPPEIDAFVPRISAPATPLRQCHLPLDRRRSCFPPTRLPRFGIPPADAPRFHAPLQIVGRLCRPWERVSPTCENQSCTFLGTTDIEVAQPDAVRQ
jgi:hypothetical protein